MQVSRCFRLQGSFSRIIGSRGLVGGPLPTPRRKPHCRKYFPPYTPRYCRRLQILAFWLTSRPPAPLLRCLALAEIRGKRHRTSIVLVVRVCRLGYLLGAKLEKTQRTPPLASNYVWFWCICCSTKLSRQEHNF